ncbi:hypothetical protein ABB37_05275 [Leptomonas pyrrhocoris]|uniref:Uncharacterized protein n=1 Tax=Leptomonas pyrrhocoris TaxID=157538 RepID=A0A0M9G047_LEPPY|nr:hypothetical protein ABB37_05275 [Leptomonas pyrrhocoris]XP_015657876.1 hypothetical protein ABB37_05275 [Leptomonas pyrrhocoris]KPA79436.1 hypothetical protein ABB37_05275 [Leptomonas pyrrhocoris]KPA79437.1 hypothetical protein ABB37_05275 [Leptomonas pyrrhocoris]|eukprot:XP_015657875.1 hypothetical protein ABB37_05275 [Leptomonas pyrrhocoris]
MQSAPTAPRPLLVPSPTTCTAPPFVMVSEKDLAPYTSTVVPLPPSIPELIQCWERQHERCAQMTRFIERVRAETAKMAAAPLSAVVAEALSTPKAAALSVAGPGAASTPPPLPPPPSNNGATIQSPSGGVVARGVVADGKPATSSGAAVAGTVVRGTVITGKVVSATGTAVVAGGSADGSQSPPPRAVVASAAVVATPAQPPSATATVATAAASGATPQISPDELQVLRAKAITVEATEQLLENTQEELRTSERNLTREKENLVRAQSRLAELRAAMTAKDADTSAPSPNDAHAQQSLFAQQQIALELNEAVLSDTKLKYQSVLYALAQLTEQLATNAREKAFLEEKNTHLEGQLQRLLMSSMVTGSPTAPAPTQRSTAASTATAANATASTKSAPAPPAAPRLSASESYQKSALEKQITELQSMTDKLTRDLRKQTARRAKAEETVQALQKEVADLKASALQFRRQINESELELERTVSRKEDDERLRQLERDGNCLRTALRERTEHFLREKTEWERERDVLEARARVQERATCQLLRRMLAYQVREVTLRQCEYAASARQKEAKSSSASLHGSPTALPAKQAVSRLKGAADTSETPSGIGTRRAEFFFRPTNASASATPTNDGPSVTSPSSSPVGSAADTATLVNRERQLEELKHTFDRRVALVEAQRKAEVQQLHALNKELRAALTTSQEELTQQKRLFDTAQQQQQQRLSQTPGKYASASSATAVITPVVPARSSSSISERRDTAAAWVCRTDIEGSPPGASMDDWSDGAGGVYSTAHTPLTVSPRRVTEVERRYDPEHMSTWEAVQVENEALLDRLTTMQEEKWKLTSYVEDLQRQSNTLKEELRRNASTMNQLLAAGVLTPAAVSRGSAEGSLRALQCLLQETLQEKFTLEEKLRGLNAN